MGVGLPWDETKGALNRGRKIEVSSSLVAPSPLPRRAAYVPGSRSSCTFRLAERFETITQSTKNSNRASRG